MADPITASAAVAGGLTLGKGVADFMGVTQKGKAEEAAANYQAGVAGINAQLAREQGNIQALNQGLRTGQLVGTQTAAQGASGVDITSGSSVAVRSTAEQMGRLDALTILSNAARKAWSFETQQELDKFKAKYAGAATKLAQVGSVLGTASNLASKWSSFSNTGIMPGWGSSGDGGGW